jgi:hypothetical protein
LTQINSPRRELRKLCFRPYKGSPAASSKRVAALPLHPRENGSLATPNGARWKPMSKTALPPILNTSLPPQFRQIRLELAREPGHPEGEAAIAYVFLAPLDDDGRIEPELWKHHREACRVARLRPGQDDIHGHLIHRPGGSWAFQYETADLPDEAGYHFGDERFVLGEYVSINEERKLHTFRVTAVTRL